MEKLSEILWGILNNERIKHKFEYQSGVARMAMQKIAIYLRNVVGYLKVFMGHPGFWYNQTYEPSCI